MIRQWLVVLPLAALGTVLGHEVAYAVTGSPRDDLHGYLSHLPQITVILGFLTLATAAVVERRAGLALWPFPAVTIGGFVAQEHLERFLHDGAIPFLLSQPVFLVGLALQALVAVAAWLLARLLAYVVGVEDRPPPRRPLRRAGVGLVLVAAPAGSWPAGTARPRAPPDR